MNKFRKPPCPGNPEDYQLINTKEGSHWRRKRGTVKTALLNQSFQEEQKLLKISAPASRLIVNTLKPFLFELDPGRIGVRISAVLRKDLRQYGAINYVHFLGMDLQPRFPFNQLMLAPFEVIKDNQLLHLHIPSLQERVRAFNDLVTEYYFTAILVSGDPISDNQLSIDAINSALFSHSDREQKKCRLSVNLPDILKPWMLLVKISSLEGNELAAHYKHYGMKVIAVSGLKVEPGLKFF